MEKGYKDARIYRAFLFCLCVSIITLLISTTTYAQPATEEEEPPLEEIQRFTTAIQHIKNYYVEDVTDEMLFDSAIRGMLEGLDPHSAYLDEEEFKELNVATKGEFSGLGIEVTLENGYIRVISPIDETPAAKAGIKAGDKIILLDKEPVKGLTLREAVNKMRGKRGSTIMLTILREDAAEPLQIPVIRDIIKIQSVKGKLYDGKYGYLRISHFQTRTTDDVAETIKTLQKQAHGKLEGLILDLRNNPGGLLDSAIEISDLFLHKVKHEKHKLIVYTEGRLPGSRFTAEAHAGDLLKNAPIIVLINEGSASGSEIVAGALQDHKRALIVGTRSFGKGSVQTVLPLDDKRGVKLTTALYYTPAGRSIQAEGIVPDIEIQALDVPTAKKKAVNGFAVKEADLRGHLEKVENGKAQQVKQSKENTLAQDSGQLVHSDFQLYQALNLLKGFSALHKNNLQ